MKSELPEALMEKLGSATERRSPWNWKGLAVLIVILFLGLSLRLYDLDGKSVWFDEYGPLRAIEAPTLQAMLSMQADVNRDMLPLYFIFQYYWYHYVGSAPLQLRYLSLIFGMASMLAIYLLTRTLYKESIALLTVLFVGLSPFQIFHSQVMRPYALLSLLVFLSAWSFWRLLRSDEKRWWILYLFLSALLLWTHVFAAFFVIAQGLYLVCCEERRLGRLVFWGLSQIVLVAPVACLVLSWSEKTNLPLDSVNLHTVKQFFMMDTYYLESLFFNPEWTGYSFAGLAVFLRYWIYLAVILGWMLALALFLSTLKMLAAQLPRLSAHRPLLLPGAAADRYLLFSALAPALLLTAFSFLVVPSYQGRYLIYALPLLVILFFRTCPPLSLPFRRYFLISAVFVALAVNTLSYCFVDFFPNDKDAAAYIQQEISSKDTLITLLQVAAPCFRYNYGSPDAGNQFFLHDNLSESKRLIAQSPSLLEGDFWLVSIGPQDQEELESCFSPLAYSIEHQIFPGRWRLDVYHCTTLKP